MILLVVLSQLLCACVLFAAYLRGDRRRHLRRCPTCWYDLGQTPETLTCPECGVTAADEPSLHRSRRRPIYALEAVLLLGIAIGILGFNASRDGFYGVLPRPLVAWMLDASVRPTARPMGARLPPVPAPLWANREGSWRSLCWNQQYALAIRSWADIVAGDGEPAALADVAQIGATLEIMTSWRTCFNTTFWNDSWVVIDEISRQRARIDRLGDRRVVTVTLADGASIAVDRDELFMLAFQSPLDPPVPASGIRTFRAPRAALAADVALRAFGWTTPPQAYLAAMTASTDLATRRYALSWLVNLPSREVDIDELITRLVSDPDADIRTLAVQLRLARSLRAPPP